jgi:hypothetical protein
VQVYPRLGKQTAKSGMCIASHKGTGTIIETKYDLLWGCKQQHWSINGELKNVTFTDEMSTQAGGTFGILLVWQDNTQL